MKILIPGGAGYIGNCLTSALLICGHQVTILDNLVHKQHGILDNCTHPRFSFVYGDVRDTEVYKSLISKNDIIINLAAYVGMPICKKYPIEARQVNQISSEFLAKNVSKDQLVIYSTTNSGYGAGQHKDGLPVLCTEETPANPISLYGETKYAGEKALMENGNAISLRLATVFGISKRMRMDLLVNDFTWRAWNDKFIVLFESHFVRNFVYIQDVIGTMIFSLNNQDKMKGQVYNVGNSDINISKMELCNAIKKHIPEFYITTSEINKDPDQRNYIVSNDKLEKLGWACKYSLDFGIREIIKACPIIKNTNMSFSYI